MSNLKKRAFIATETVILLTAIVFYIIWKILPSHAVTTEILVLIWFLTICLSIADLWFIVVAITSYFGIDVLKKMMIIKECPKDKIF